MKMSKKAVNRLQNLTLLLLTVSALTLLAQIPLFSDGWDGRVQALLSAAPADHLSSQAGDLASSIPSLHLVTTDNSEYGRHSQLYLDAGSPDLANVLPLFRDALGSAAGAISTTDRAFQSALNSPSLFLSLTSPLPSSVIATWLGGETALEQEIHTMALTVGRDDSAALYLCDPQGAIFRYDTALSATAILDCVMTFSPNGGSFAFETNYTALQPYTVLVAQASSYTDIYSNIPDGFSAYNLLTALDFNAHTSFRYFEASGTEVVQESPRTLRISPDGTAAYSGDATVDFGLYQIPTTDGTVSAVEALQASMHLAATLVDGTDASPLYLRSITPTDVGWQIDFAYQTQGLPVLLPHDAPALSVTISGSSIVYFTYCCRSFNAAETPSTLLPASIATAIAAQHPQSGLTICYTDSGEDLLSAQWLAG